MRRGAGKISWASQQSLLCPQHGISAKKTKLMTNNTSGIHKIDVNELKPETVTRFKYQVSVVTDEDSKPEILSRIAQTTGALTRLKPVWNDGSISLSSKIRLLGSLVTSIFLCACESWTLTAELQRKEYKPWKRGATERYYTSHTKTMLPTRTSVPRSSRQSNNTKTSWPW